MSVYAIYITELARFFYYLSKTKIELMKIEFFILYPCIEKNAQFYFCPNLFFPKIMQKIV